MILNKITVKPWWGTESPTKRSIGEERVQGQGAEEEGRRERRPWWWWLGGVLGKMGRGGEEENGGGAALFLQGA